MRLIAPLFFLLFSVGLSAQTTTGFYGNLSVGAALVSYDEDNIAIDAQLRYSGGKIGELELGRFDLDVSEEDFSYGFGRLNLGVTFFL
jgi:hypothetical protein